MLISGASTMHGSVSIGQSLTATGETKLKNTLSVSGKSYIEDSLSIGTTLDVIGATTLTNTLSVSDTVTVGSHIIPETNESSDLGSAGKRFRDIFISDNSVHMGRLEE